MIERYCYPEMKALWELESKYAHWLEVELAVCDAQAQLGLIPKAAAVALREKARFTVERIEEIEKEVDHDLIAFIKACTEPMGEEQRYFHLGMTSYDIEDTALGLQLVKACEMITGDIQELISTLKERALEHKTTLMMGRTHGIHAEPITFGVKLAVWVEEMKRNLDRMKRARDVVGCGKISGAVGTYANIDPRIETLVCERLGLQASCASTQVLQRDRHAEYLTTLAIIAASLEKFATEIRNLQRTDILEVEEPFKKGQRGSSAMPHKRNPITCERICGQSRVVRANALIGLENVALWHERDITNSSAERVALPDSSCLVDYMLRRFTNVMRGLNVYPERMLENLNRTQGVIHSQQVLLALVDRGWTREEAYKVVQEKAMQAWTERLSFRSLLESDAKVTGTLTEADLDACFDPTYHIRHADYIFDRVGIG
ncbi:MAG: adenylosuccinate lyase [Armatimonadetes bacterium]|nr:adenylosuccinate lyase [Armatimonadota bacterium]